MADKLLRTKMWIMRPGVDIPEIRDLEFKIPEVKREEAFDHNPEDFGERLFPGPGLTELKAVIMPALDPGSELEHVSVMWQGKRGDMFVDECGRLPHRNLARNELATAVYRENWLQQHPEWDTEALHPIHGIAVVFDDRIWF